MLKRIYGRDLALIRECDLTFSPCLTVLSGETGAGKSIVAGSIAFALGEKPGKDLIRTNSDSAYVELEFSSLSPAVRDFLKREGLPEEETLILSRKQTENRSITRVNGEQISRNLLQELSSLLMNLHGQHDHQTLLHKENHLFLLDKYGESKVKPFLDSYSLVYSKYKNVRELLQKADALGPYPDRELDRMRYEIDEIRDAALTEGEEEELREEYRRLSHEGQLKEALQEAAGFLSDGRSPALDSVGSAIQAIQSVLRYDEDMEKISSPLYDAEAILQDTVHAIHNALDTFGGEERLEEVTKRLEEIRLLKRKYGNTVDEILRYREERIREYKELKALLKEKNANEERLRELEAELNEEADRLTEARKDAASGLSREIAEALKDLNFLQTDMEAVFFDAGELTPKGKDRVEFYISTNPGEPLKPLEKTASGGEASRIMLAFQSILSKHDEVPTMLFDEIDAGISGRTAQSAAWKLHKLSKEKQLIIISHLPQIVSMADTHYKISKHADDEGTVTEIRLLNEEESTEELARLIGGVRITDLTMQSAREMRDLVQKEKIRLEEDKL